jgi:hypothetical protein
LKIDGACHGFWKRHFANDPAIVGKTRQDHPAYLGLFQSLAATDFVSV